MADKKISALTGATTPLAGTEVLPIVQSSSTVKVSVANLTAGRAVAATSMQFGSGSVLSSYEEGTWSPVFSAATAPTGVTYSVQAGTYTKVGNLVNVSCFLEISSKGTGGGGAIQITGLPYAIGSATGNYSSIQPEILNVTMPVNANNLYVRTNPSASYLGVEFLDTSALSTSAGRGSVQYSDSGNSFRLICQTTYRV